jgi:coenzyme F420-0:L-glutamate ligase/coenzyme F420-1:gamma-L-glutamate ligase
MAVIDELAAAGELVKGKRDGVPVAVVRGQPWGAPASADLGAAALVRDAASDMFSLGTAEAHAAGLRAAATLPDAATDDPADPAAVARALALAGSASFVLDLPRVICTPPSTDPAALVRFGADVHRLRAALLAEGVASTADDAVPVTLTLSSDNLRR